MSALLYIVQLVCGLGAKIAGPSLWMFKVILMVILVRWLTEKAEKHVLKEGITIGALSLCEFSTGLTQDQSAGLECRICWDIFTSRDTVVSHSKCENAWHDACLLTWLMQSAESRMLCVACRTPLDNVEALPKVGGKCWRIGALDDLSRRLFRLSLVTELLLLPVLVAYNRYILYGVAGTSFQAYLIGIMADQFACWNLASAFIEVLRLTVRAGSQRPFQIHRMAAYFAIYASLMIQLSFPTMFSMVTKLSRTANLWVIGRWMLIDMGRHAAAALVKAYQLLKAAEVLA